MDISELGRQSITDRLSSNAIRDLKRSADSTSTAEVNSKKQEKEKKALKDACQGFEAMFLNIMLKSMRDTVPDDGLFGKSQGMDIYTSMHDQYLAEKISRGENSTGLGEYLYRQLQDSIKS